jgi:hypothetical protein
MLARAVATVCPFAGAFSATMARIREEMTKAKTNEDGVDRG